jgi:phosphoglycolate phosphatase
VKDKNILLSFDLDNTLINNKEGIVNSFNYALKRYKIPPLEGSEIEKMIGTPLDDMFKEVSDISPQTLSSIFREYYGKKGIYQASLLPGVKEKLEELKQKSFTLGVITSKKHEMAVRITKYLGIYSYFEYILGESENIKSKLDPNLKKYLLNKYKDYKIVIIGDHPKDKALAEGLLAPFIGVLTGNHAAEELQQNPKVKTVIVNSVKELNPNLIYSLL